VTNEKEINMSEVITEISTIKCAHQGKVSFTAGQSRLTVNGVNVLVAGDLGGKTISDCKTPATSSTSPCKVATPLPGGVALKLKINGKGALLKEINGTTDGVGVPVLTWSVLDAGQTKLKAV
jgi:hypothetical protein